MTSFRLPACKAGSRTTNWTSLMPRHHSAPQPARCRGRSGGTVGSPLVSRFYATLSGGRKIFGPNTLRAGLIRLSRLQLAHARKAKGGKNWTPARAHPQHPEAWSAQAHHLACPRERNLCDRGYQPARQRQIRSLARPIADMGFRELRRQLGYKLQRDMRKSW